ncbi:hypothetical protein [Natronorubrum halophilum]|uniref:hypothetical protein n=1 Tax=Natronorubrum halophilum TaxID=1702106 RepID=UPI000EF6E0F1|nr:hypothetical protein [Natronorubrum halophilum]
MKGVGTAAVGVPAGVFATGMASAGYCDEPYSDTSSVTETYWSGRDGSTDWVEKEFAEVVRVEVDGPKLQSENNNRAKYYVAVHQLSQTYVKSDGEPQIDIMDQSVKVEYPDEGNTAAEWDFADPDSEPTWISRASADAAYDGYSLEDFAQDFAVESFKTGMDVFEETIATPVKVTVDLYDYTKKAAELADKFNDATGSTRTQEYSWFYSGDEASSTSFTSMIFKVEDIPWGATESHTIEVESQTGQQGTMHTHEFNFDLHGPELCR